ncbi:hypothetical protein AAGF08_01505 [Algoriphagus sp. SE2]|uniref:hypothetical protein n=1 Tax=Algoriphagus sp. SE2 TaxID=3141536 RepID=UPI0031CD93D3
MKFLRYQFLLLIILGFVSCKEDKDLLPITPLEGTWQYSYYNQDQQFFFIYQYIFNPDGTMEKSILIRESDTPKILGYYSNALGTYELRGETYSEVLERQFVLALDAYVFYVPKEKLIEVEVTSGFSNNGTLIFSENNRSFELGFTCNDTPSGRTTSCQAAITYKRVD